MQKGDGKGTESFGECVHPVFRTNEDTGRKAVYVNRLMTVGIEGMPQEEAKPLLNAVFDHAEKQEFVYEHVWRMGDLLLWDNRCSSHARTISLRPASADRRGNRRAHASSSDCPTRAGRRRARRVR